MKQGGEAVVVIVCLIGMFWSGVETINTLRELRIDEIKAQCNVIDKTLEGWSKYHMRSKEDSKSYAKDGISYQKCSYPNKLEELQFWGFIPQTIDLSIFRYETRDSGFAYHLEVDLPNKRTYTSQGSTF